MYSQVNFDTDTIQISLFTIPFHELSRDCYIHVNDVFQGLFFLREVHVCGISGDLRLLLLLTHFCLKYNDNN